MARKPDDTRQLLIALSYVIWPVALILLIVEETRGTNQKRDAELRHHAYNALGFWAGVLILSLPVWAVAWIPIFGPVATVLYWAAVIVLAIVFALRAYRGEQVCVPVMTDFLKRNVKEF